MPPFRTRWSWEAASQPLGDFHTPSEREKFMKALSIKAKIAVVSAIAVCIIGLVAGENYLTLKSMNGLAAEAQTAHVLMRQHMDGDMMHDAIRADVLKATLGLK